MQIIQPVSCMNRRDRNVIHGCNKIQNDVNCSREKTSVECHSISLAAMQDYTEYFGLITP